MKKNIIVMKLEILHVIILATTACLLTACSSEEYLGAPPEVGATGNAISFNGGTGRMTRAGGAEAAKSLNYNFVVYGFKTNTDTKSTVYNHYNVKYTDGTAHSTESNTAGWEYVGQAPNVLNAQLSSDASYTQDIKYWDFAADRYDFIAFSAGAATQQAVTGKPGDPGYPGTPATDNVIFTPVDNAHLTDAAYTITGATSDLTKVYIADRITATKDATTKQNVLYPYKNAIQFAFKPLAAKVRIGLYETIPGYSVKDVKFYKADDTYETDPLSSTPLLFAGSETMPSGIGTVTLKFNSTDDTSNKDYNKVEVASYANGLGRDVLLADIKTDSYAGKENMEGGNNDPETVFLARASNVATTSEYQAVVPTGKAHSMTLKMDYTLLSTDKSQETIKVRGATAVIPSEFCNWQPNHAYTYLFKISDNTSGWTNPDDEGHVGLYPVTFDAIVAATEEGMQQTITLMANPSITTYAKGEKIHEDANKVNYYEKGDYNLYICLQPSTLSMTSSNVKMYMASASDSSPIVESTVADVIKNGTESPAGTFSMDPVTVTTTGAPALTIKTAIPAKDAPYGTAILGNFAVFQPTAEGTYVFEYTSPEEQYTYDEYKALTGNESVTQQQYNELKAANSPLLLKPNKHYKVIVVKEAPVAP